MNGANVDFFFQSVIVWNEIWLGYGRRVCWWYERVSRLKHESHNIVFGSDDTDVDLYEEYDQWHWSVWGMWLYLFYIDLLIKL